MDWEKFLKDLEAFGQRLAKAVEDNPQLIQSVLQVITAILPVLVAILPKTKETA